MSDYLLGAALGILIYKIHDSVIPFIADKIYYYKVISGRNKIFKEKKRKLEESEELRDWINVGLPTGERVLVCQNTGYCPSKDAFLETGVIKALIRADKLEEEYENHKEEELIRIADEIGISVESLVSASERVIEIRKKYVISKMGDFLNELKEKREEDHDSQG